MAGEDLLARLQQTLSSDPENPSHHFNIGILLWKKGDEVSGDKSNGFKARAAEHFLASAKLNPGDGASFRLLGHYYSVVVVDVQRAIKCYQRALSLCPDDFEAGEALCDLLDVSGRDSLQLAVCQEASGKSPKAFWAFRRLGYLQVHHKKWEEAVQSLQHAIRGYPKCADLWEALGHAYHRLGRLTAAIKSYGRAIELEDSRIFSLIESGNILLMLGSFRKGIEMFRHALEASPHSVAAHFGLASGLLGLSKECACMGAYEWVASLLKEASKITIACSELSSNFSSVWKLHGDIQIAYAKCIPWENKMTVSHIDEGSFKESINEWKNKCLTASKKALFLYQRALHLTPWQSNIYADMAITLDLINALDVREKADHDSRFNGQLSERMSLGSLLFEGINGDFWVILACITNDYALKQHALIRGLQLNISSAVSWAYLGKLYKKLGENHLASQAFDRARSLDPSLALPWAGMSVASYDRNSFCEAYESCLRAVQIMPLAEFQIGLGMLARHSGHLSSPQVFDAVRHSIQRSPYYPESHNVHGLICEARLDYQSAISAYRLAKFSLKISQISPEAIKSCLNAISVNLARVLCQAGHMVEAEQECEALDKDGNYKVLQIYAVALWKLGKNDQVLHVARNLAKNASTLEKNSCTAAIGLICQLIYHISGLEFAISTLLKMPREYLSGAKMSVIISAVNALDSSNRLQLLLPADLSSLEAYDLIVKIHIITAMNKMIHNGSEQSLDIHSGVKYLRRVLRLYPDSRLLRDHLGSLLLYSGDWLASHVAPRCTVLQTGYPTRTSLKSPIGIHGGAGVSCYSSCVTRPKFSFPTCKCQPMHGLPVIYHLQRWLHLEPWNLEARYLLVLNVLQRAREEKFPPHLCLALKRLISVALYDETYMKSEIRKYQRFLLLLSASEICLQSVDYAGCTNYVVSALEVLPTHEETFLVHLQLCRAYAAQEDLTNILNEYMNCLNFKTVNPISWLSLKYLESRYQLQDGSKTVELNFKMCFKEELGSSNMLEAVFGLVCALCFIWDKDFISAEQALAHACAISKAESCVLLAHGAVCMELARQQMGSQFLSRAVKSLVKAQAASPFPLPILSALLAQVEGSIGAKAKWERNLRLEWFSWPAEMRPAELYFQMHILARQSAAASDQQTNIESCQSPERWVLRAIHLNPSCLRYWKVIQKLTDGS